MFPSLNSPTRLAAAVVLTVLPVLAACGGHTGGSSGPAPTGTLAITITTPAGVVGAVSVSGPQSFHKTLAASQTFANVPTGVYTITADSVVTPDSVIGSRTDTATVSQASVTVAQNDTATGSVNYALKQLRGVMLVSNDGLTSPQNTSLYLYGSTVLRSSGAPTPADTIGGLNKPTGMAFDPSGNLWIANENSDTLDMYTPAELEAGGDPTPARKLIASQLTLAVGLRFDPKGNMWATSGKAMYGFKPTQLSAGGAQTAAIEIISSAMLSPIDILFDSTGNAWVSDYANQELLHFTATQLSATGSPTPGLIISATAGSLQGPAGMTSDASGNVWVANYNGGTIVEYAASKLTATGSPAPTHTVTLAAGAAPWGLAWDQRGSLWYGDFGLKQIGAFTASQLAAGGAPTPAVALTGNWPAYVLFNASMPVPGNGSSAARVRPHAVVAPQAVTPRVGRPRVPGLE